MKAKWLGILALIFAGISLLSVSSCGDPQTLQSVTIQPSTETFGASNIPVIADAGLQVQLTALGSYLHPPATKDITSQVTWASSSPQMFTITSTGLLTATGQECGGTLVSATLQTNTDGSGLSSSGAIVTGNMTANVVCFTGNGGGGGGEPTLTVNFLGSGTGTVTSSSGSFSCASTAVSCIDSFPSGTTVTLTATPVPPSTFGGWSGGACTGTSTCILLLQTDTIVTATFN
jgi:List-Bact-rpt repeat protein